jgi:hypothetical protein
LMNMSASRQDTVMPGLSRPRDGVAAARLCPGIHVFLATSQDVDGRDEPGHDEVDRCMP